MTKSKHRQCSLANATCSCLDGSETTSLWNKSLSPQEQGVTADTGLAPVSFSEKSMFLSEGLAVHRCMQMASGIQLLSISLRTLISAAPRPCLEQVWSSRKSSRPCTMCTREPRSRDGARRPPHWARAGSGHLCPLPCCEPGLTGWPLLQPLLCAEQTPGKEDAAQSCRAPKPPHHPRTEAHAALLLDTCSVRG